MPCVAERAFAAPAVSVQVVCTNTMQQPHRNLCIDARRFDRDFQAALTEIFKEDR
jgi:hypothetical protein